MRFSFKTLYKVIAVRLRKNDPVITCRDSGDPAPVATPGVLFSPALPSDSSEGHAVAARIERRAQAFTVGMSDKVQLTLGGAQGIAGPIPLVGSPLKAAIGGLLTILQTIDRHAQNKATIASLRSRLHRLSGYLCNASSAHDSFEQSRRDELINLLRDTSDQLAKLDNGGLVYQSVTQALAGLSTELDRYLAEYAFAAQMHTQNYVVEIKTQLQQFRGSATMDLPGTVTRHCLILEDATGKEHRIPMEFCMSLRQLNRMLGVLFESSADKACIQRRYLEQGQYDLCIDQGTQVIELTSETDEWSRIEAGTKVVMRVIIDKDLYSASAPIKCDACGCLKYSVQPADNKGSRCWMICCQGCNRRYQVTIPSRLRDGDGTIPQATDPKELNIIRNTHVRERVRLLREEEEREERFEEERFEFFFFDEARFELFRERRRFFERAVNQCLSKQALHRGHEHVLVNPPSIVSI